MKPEIDIGGGVAVKNCACTSNGGGRLGQRTSPDAPHRPAVNKPVERPNKVSILNGGILKWTADGHKLNQDEARVSYGYPEVLRAFRVRLFVPHKQTSRVARGEVREVPLPAVGSRPLWVR